MAKEKTCRIGASALLPGQLKNNIIIDCGAIRPAFLEEDEETKETNYKESKFKVGDELFYYFEDYDTGELHPGRICISEIEEDGNFFRYIQQHDNFSNSAYGKDSDFFDSKEQCETYCFLHNIKLLAEQMQELIERFTNDK